MDILQEAATSLKPRSLDEMEVTLDLGDLALNSFTNESFDDLIARKGATTGNLVPLRKCRLVLRDGGRLRLVNPHPGASESSYLELQEMLLRAAGFTEVAIREPGPPLVVEAVKRKPLAEEQDFGMTVRELVDPQDIEATHEFARDIYYYKDFNYDTELVRHFDLHTDVFATYDKNGEMVSMARCALRVPGYDCPFMYATAPDGAHFHVPSRFRSIGEMMAINKEGKSGVVAFKRLMECLTQYICFIARLDSVWTTNDVNDPYTGNYYKTRFLMADMGVTLTYRDFGGKWNLICTDKVPELAAIHQDLFRR